MDRRIDLAVAAAFMALGIFIIIQAAFIKSGMMRDPIGPRAAFYVMGGILALGGLTLIVKSLRSWSHTSDNMIRSEGVEDEAGHTASAGRAFLIMGSALLYGLLFNPLGYLIATPLFIIAALKILGERSWLTVTLIAVIFTVVTYVIFAHALGVRIAVGPLTGPFRALGIINL